MALSTLKKIAIIGVGSIGSVVAWHLARAGLAPKLVAREATAEALAREGLTLTGAGKNERVAVDVTTSPENLGPQDLVLAGFKAQDWAAGLASVLPLMGPHTVLVPLLNGVPWWFFQGFAGPEQGRIVEAVDPGGKLAGAINPAQVLGGVVYVAAERETPARVYWNGRKRIVLGETTGGSSERLDAVAALLRSAGLEAEASLQIRQVLWHKLLGNVAFNPLSVVTGATMGRMVSHPPLRAILKAMMEEALEVGQALGIPREMGAEERLNILPVMFDFRTSMLQDFQKGRPLELVALTGAMGELAAMAGIPTPMIAAIGALAAERSATA